jgi:hypothetical protein
MRGQAMVETLLAFPLLLLAFFTAAQVAVVAIAGLLTRHAANVAARAAAVTGASVTEARRAAAGVCAPVDRSPSVERLEPSDAAFADFGDRFAFDDPDPRRGARTRLTAAEAARVVVRVTCRAPLAIPVAGPLLARVLGRTDGRLPLVATGRHRLQSDPVRAPKAPRAAR